MLASNALGLLVLVTSAVAAPLISSSPAPEVRTIQIRANSAAVSVLSASAKAEVATFAELARVAYCSAASVTAGTASSSIVAIAAGGHDQLIPGWFVAYSASLKAIIVAHQGTNSESLLSILEDAHFIPTPLPEAMFPGAGAAGVKVHSGFQNTQGFTAAKVLAAVKSGVAKYGTSKVITVGHSLGAAIAELDAIYLKLQIPSLTVSARLFGLPRTGNDAFAPYALKVVPDSTHTTNQNDVVPRLPGRALGFQQINGEQWITPDNVYQSCPGVENTLCAVGQSVLKFSFSDHAGPYAGVFLGGDYCTL
ncbi:Alpha/Beta hydrolase protein [Mrakia frigida]|uniref:lipase family protein n=1 Tax=Mrakia frigida TaxID=29902 RepID=UPI003FCC2620